MWIIPKNLSIYHYAQDTGALILDFQELSDQLEQSVMWRSKPSQSKTWYRRLKKDCSLQLLFLQTLKSFPGKSLVEKWTYSQGASLVSHLVSQEENKEIKTLDIYGHTSQKGLNSWEDLPLFSSKTFQESSQASSKETTGQIKRGLQFCFMSLESWKDWVTKQRRAHSQRLKLARHTKGKECSFLVSEMNSNRAELILSMDSLSQINQISSQYGQHQEDKNSTVLNHQESQWGTPTTRDWKDAGLKKESKPRKDGTRRMTLCPQQVLFQENYRGKLNPRWIEMLMGVPIGWTMPSCMSPMTIEQTNFDCLEMELYPIQHQELSKSFGKNWMTPIESDHKQICLSKKALQHRLEKGSQLMLSTQVHLIEHDLNHLELDCLDSKSLMLPELFDDCIVDYKSKKYVYCKDCIIKKLTFEFSEAIKSGILEMHNKKQTIKEHAHEYAIEYFSEIMERNENELYPRFISPC